MQPYRIKSIKEYHQLLGLKSPAHPVMSVVDLSLATPYTASEKINVIFDFYMITLKEVMSGHVQYQYGQQHYDVDEGVLFFIAPGQVFSFQADDGFKSNGWMLLIHPDFLWGNNLAKTIKQYDFFSYSVNEALFVSEKEKEVLQGFIANIEQELHARIDKFTERIILSQVEALLSYSERFYQRQFITRKIINHKIVIQLEAVLNDYFSDAASAHKSIPTVEAIALQLNMSPNYLSNLLRTITGKSTQDHIHDKLIEMTKEQLSATNLTINEIAYNLGFDYPQTFSKLFKRKVAMTPLAFRATFD